ncbi:hypothetical protein [Aliikangiella sp. G2MR2-5]|uniref:hypothetical protein n=1 Tax=Aliikangiella sp. G2MR2-5 TaxID=2788943 RepID=UPI0018AC66B6|nr:hypothetical protein [Aliikangiella sp. G2MR2-5]
MKYIIFAILSSISVSLLAAETSVKGKITGYYTGWGSDTVRVRIEGATYAESDCPVKDGYMTSESDNKGFKTHTSALLAAYMSGKSVSIVVEGCVNSRPRIWGVYID